MSMSRQLRRFTLLVAGLAIAGLWGASAAWAHVTVTAPGVVAGDSDATIVFRVPTESDTASTIGLKLQLPTNTPIAGVLVAPQQGWTATITQTKLAKPIQTDDGAITEVVSEVDWKADAGAGIKPGFFGQFTIIGGKLPTGSPPSRSKPSSPTATASKSPGSNNPHPAATPNPTTPRPPCTCPPPTEPAQTRRRRTAPQR